MFIEIRWRVHFWYEEKHQIIKSSCFRSGHRGGRLGSEILFPGRTGASSFLQLFSRTEVSANCEALLVYRGSANVVSPNKIIQGESSPVSITAWLPKVWLWSHWAAGRGSRAGTAKEGQNCSCTVQCWSSIQSSTCGWMHLYPPTYFA